MIKYEDIQRWAVGFMGLTTTLLQAALWVLLAIGLFQGNSYTIAASAIPLALFYLAEIRNAVRKTDP